MCALEYIYTCISYVGRSHRLIRLFKSTHTHQHVYVCVHIYTLQVSEAALLQGLANRALELEAKREQSKPAAAAGAGAAAAAVRTANKRWHIGELLELLPCLAEGLDVNVRFDGYVVYGYVRC